MEDKPIFECKRTEEVFDLLEPLIFTLPADIRNTFENEITSHGINGESLIFFNSSYLNELKITDTNYQNIIMKAIYSLYSTKILSQYLSKFNEFQSTMISQSIMDAQINLESLKNEGHELIFYKNILQIQNDNIINEFIKTFEMIFNHPINNTSIQDEKQNDTRTRGSVHRDDRSDRLQSTTTLPKLDVASSANLSAMKKSIEEYTCVLSKLRESTNAKDILSIIEPLKSLNGNKLKTEMYSIPATQMLHKIMFHETSLAKKPEEIDDENVLTDAVEKLNYNGSTCSVLNYIATNKITSTLGTSLLCHGGVTLKQLEMHMLSLSENKKLSYNVDSNIADSSTLLNICHTIHRSYRSTSIETIAFLIIDVDSFYVINQEYSNRIGDELLIKIGDALFNTVQNIYNKKNMNKESKFECCEFYHAENNRFYVLISVSSEEEATDYGQIIVNMMRETTFNIENNNLKRTVSVSVYLYNPKLSVTNIKSNAHIPLYYAKHNGKNQVISYSKVRELNNKKTSMEIKSNIWSKQLYDMIGVYGKYSYHLCKVMTKRLINNKGVNINWINRKDGNNTILMYCLENRFIDLVEFYLRNFINKLDFNIKRDDGSNALLLSIKYDFNKGIVEKIMNKTDKQNRNITNKWNDNTVQLAKIKGLHQIINSLTS